MGERGWGARGYCQELSYPSGKPRRNDRTLGQEIPFVGSNVPAFILVNLEGKVD
jgi:hypothetical protein